MENAGVEATTTDRSDEIAADTNHVRNSAAEKRKASNGQDVNKDVVQPIRAKKPKKMDAFQEAYENLSFVPIPSTGRPGTPHRFFSESYEVIDESMENINGNDEAISPKQIVHKHANGLCIVTAGHLPVDVSVELVEILVQGAPHQSQNEKRKNQSKMLRGITQSIGTVKPRDDIAKISLSRLDGEGETTTRSIKAGVWGTVLEVNPNMSPGLLQIDPLLDGYLVVIFPTGPFPPPKRVETNT